jgi:hypothetical protein
MSPKLQDELKAIKEPVFQPGKLAVGLVFSTFLLLVFWSWSLEAVYLRTFLSGDQYSKYNDARLHTKGTQNPFLERPNLSIRWPEFIENHLPEEKSLKLISPKKLNEYIYTSFNQENLIQN